MMILERQKKYTAILVNYQRLAATSLILPLLICPLLLSTLTKPAYSAPDTLDLQIGDPAVIRWDIADIRPGDSGTAPINLHNAGDIPGYIYIWISDIADGEGLNPESETGNTAEPGELSSYLYLDIVNPGMTFGRLSGTYGVQYYDLPVAMASFPGSSSQALFIKDTTINAGEILTLQWRWSLPAAAGNQAQGDTVSFTFNYMLSSYYPEPVYVPDEPVNNPLPTMPPTNPATPLPTTEPSPTPTSTDVPDDDIPDTDGDGLGDVTPVPTATTTSTVAVTEEPSDNEGILAQASLGVMISGTSVMVTLAAIERWRRYRRMKLDN
jgi:hypothetical protein